MTLPAFPNTLPVPLQDGYRTRGPDPVVRTEMESGGTYARRRDGTVWTPVSIRLFLETETQVATLDTFWRSTLNCGVSRFTMPIWTMKHSTFQTRTCRWEGGAPSYEPGEAPGQAFATFDIAVLDF